MPIKSDPSMLSPSGRPIGRFLGYYYPESEEGATALKSGSPGINIEFGEDVLVRSDRDHLGVYVPRIGQYAMYEYGDPFTLVEPTEVVSFYDDQLYNDYGTMRNIANISGKLFLIPYKNRVAVYKVSKKL